MEKLSKNKILAIVIAAIVLVLILAECQAETISRDKTNAESSGASETVESRDPAESETEPTDGADTEGTDGDESEYEQESVHESDEMTEATDAPSESE